jgi:hypothetical protein
MLASQNFGKYPLVSHIGTVYLCAMDNAEQLHTPQFNIARIAAAGEVSADTIRQWFKRKVLTTGMADTAEPETKGLARFFSGATALHIAIMGRCITLGVSPHVARKAGQLFAHEGDKDRDPGHLFPSGYTVLVLGADDAALVNVKPDTPLLEVMANYSALAGWHGPLGFLVLDELVDAVRGRLGLPRDPLAAKGSRRSGYREG